MDQPIFTDRHKFQKAKIGSKHTKNSLSEPTLKLSSTLILQEQIREYLKKDQEKRLPKLKMKHSRDVSYIRDQKCSKLKFNQINLPKSLNELKNIDSCKSFSQFSLMCNRPSCLSDQLTSRSEALSNPVKYLESLTKSHPSGRKEAENLLDWYLYMKNTYESDPEFELVIWKCAEELCRQLTVECRERGELFKVIFDYFQGVFDAKTEDIRSYCENYEQICKKKIVKLQVHHLEEIEKIKKKNEELMNLIVEKENEIEKIVQELMIYKKRFYKMHREIKENKERSSKVTFHQGFEIRVEEPRRKSRAHKTELIPQSYKESNISSNTGSYACSNASFSRQKSPISIQILEFYKDKSEQTHTTELQNNSTQANPFIHFQISNEPTISISPAAIILKSLRLNKSTQFTNLNQKNASKSAFSKKTTSYNDNEQKTMKKRVLSSANQSIDSFSSSNLSETSLKKSKIKYKKGSILITPAKSPEKLQKNEDQQAKKLKKAENGKKRKSDFIKKPKKSKNFSDLKKSSSFLHSRHYNLPEVNEIYLTPYLASYKTLSLSSSPLALSPSSSPFNTNELNLFKSPESNH